jgi:hypothetical protein
MGRLDVLRPGVDGRIGRHATILPVDRALHDPYVEGPRGNRPSEQVAGRQREGMRALAKRQALEQVGRQPVVRAEQPGAFQPVVRSDLDPPVGRDNGAVDHRASSAAEDRHADGRLGHDRVLDTPSGTTHPPANFPSGTSTTLPGVALASSAERSKATACRASPTAASDKTRNRTDGIGSSSVSMTQGLTTSSPRIRAGERGSQASGSGRHFP